MDAAPAAGPGLLIADRYRLEAELSRSPQGCSGAPAISWPAGR